MSEPRAWTEDEVRDKFYAQIEANIQFWENCEGKNQKEIIDGIIFSFLVMLDGGCIDIPGFKVIPDPHEDDKRFHRDEGKNWYPNDVDIAGCLHELWCRRHREIGGE